MRVRDVIEALSEFDPGLVVSVNGGDIIEIKRDEGGYPEIRTEVEARYDW